VEGSARCGALDVLICDRLLGMALLAEDNPLG
jgi:hypothetical protein